MSRKFTPDETLVDQLLLDDTEAFEELYHRYCFSLYSFCLGKLNSADDARQIVRDLFISLWEKRHGIPVDFSIRVHLYSEVRRAVLNCLNEKLNHQSDLPLIEEKIIPGFSAEKLWEARRPVRQFKNGVIYEPVKRQDPPWWNQYPSYPVKKMKLAFQKVLHLF